MLAAVPAPGSDTPPSLPPSLPPQVNPPCTYAHVMHVVRHPLKLLASSIDFGQCVECWAHIEDNSVPSLGSLAVPMRASLLRNRRARAGGKMGGRDWAEEAIDELLRGFMLYYVTWNPMIEGVAEYVKRTLLLLLLYQYYYCCCCWATLLATTAPTILLLLLLLTNSPRLSLGIASALRTQTTRACASWPCRATTARAPSAGPTPTCRRP